MAHLQVVKGGEAMGMGLADFIWLDEDGSLSWKKMSILVTKDERGDPMPLISRQTVEFFGSDGDNEAEGTTLILVPVHFLPDPTRPQPNFLILCEVRDSSDYPVPWNARAKLRVSMKLLGDDSKLVFFGFEQDYVLGDARGADWKEDPAPDFEERKFLSAERHLGSCFDAGLLIHSITNYTGYDTFDFKVGVRGFPQDIDPDPPHALVVADHLVIARYLMHKIGAEKGLIPAWEALSIFVSNATLRGSDIASVERNETDMLMGALGDLGTLRRLPHPEKGGTRCIQVVRDNPADPYQLALEVLAALMPEYNEAEPLE